MAPISSLGPSCSAEERNSTFCCSSAGVRHHPEKTLCHLPLPSLLAGVDRPTMRKHNWPYVRLRLHSSQQKQGIPPLLGSLAHTDSCGADDGVGSNDLSVHLS
mmetsp:Transcript_27872/g.84147  ORF Transcript_27872/g.84147 Transcript_27872/m.84147 type:complete len:103 (+) Transcript_27872:363-671(+)